MQIIYQMDLSGNFDSSEINVIDEDTAVLDKKQCDDTLAAVREHISEIDACIADNLDNWSFDRIAKTDLAVMRTAVAEMLYLDYIPVSVSINEAVNLSKKYGDEKSYKFVNSVLGKISKSLNE